MTVAVSLLGTYPRILHDRANDGTILNDVLFVK